MPKEIRITSGSRLIKATDFRLHGLRSSPIDFARDHVIILDDDQRPVAECWPIEREPSAEPPKPVLAMPVTRSGPAPGTASPDRPGRLTDAQREMLERLWKERPKATPAEIGEAFENKAGRTVSVMTVNLYKPA